MKQFCMKKDLIYQGRENVLFLSSNMAAMTSHENALQSAPKNVPLFRSVAYPGHSPTQFSLGILQRFEVGQHLA